MRWCLSRVWALATLVSSLGVVDGSQPTFFDLHSPRILIWNLEEKSDQASPTHTLSESAILSDNVIMDGNISKLLGILEPNDLMSKLCVVDLANERLKFEGMKAFIPLLASNILQLLNLSVILMVDDFVQLWKEIDIEVSRSSPGGGELAHNTLEISGLLRLYYSKKAIIQKNFCWLDHLVM